MIEILAIIILINFIYGLRRFETIVNPVTIFTAGFLMEVVFCLIFKKEWGLDEFHWNTMIVLGGGISLFSIICGNIETKYKEKYPYRGYDGCFWSVKYVYLLALLIINVIIQYMVYRYTISYSGGSSIGEALAAIDHDSKYGETDFKLPMVLGNLWFVFECLAYCFGYVFANYFAIKKFDKSFYVLLAFILVRFMGGFLSGSRSASVTLIVYVIILCIMQKSRYRRKKENIMRFGQLKYYAMGLCASLWVFAKSTEWIGRDLSEWGVFYYLAFYCGAEIKNLDLFMNEFNPPSKYFGQYTFSYFYPGVDNDNIITFRHHGNYMLGNVYTTFQNYYQDFGVIGSLICVIVMAYLAHWLYRRALSSRSSTTIFDFYVVAYAYICRNLFMSFFSERFYGAFQWFMVKMIIVFFILKFAFDKFGKTKVYLPENKSALKIIDKSSISNICL